MAGLSHDAAAPAVPAHRPPAGADGEARAGLGLDPLLVFERNLLAHRRLFDRLQALREDICAGGVLLAETLAHGGRLLFFGNGSSASDSQHLAAALSGRLHRERQPLAAMALGADSAACSAIAHDYGYVEVFGRQVEAHGRPGDCVIAISTSGRSMNVVRGLQVARERGLAAIALLGGDGGPARALADLAVVVPHDDGARVHEAHIFIGHTWCGQIEETLGLCR